MDSKVIIDTDYVQEIREHAAELIKQLTTIAEARPEHGNHITLAINSFRMGFMELGYCSALTKGYDPLANKVK